ncbi:hypothetical protein TcYC6_0109750 [Trypanosoma cruzi]|nr:hypothetical protein TcYC6_0109750 [Trypanosoma cruzi]
MVLVPLASVPCFLASRPDGRSWGGNRREISSRVLGHVLWLFRPRGARGSLGRGGQGAGRLAEARGGVRSERGGAMQRRRRDDDGPTEKPAKRRHQRGRDPFGAHRGPPGTSSAKRQDSPALAHHWGTARRFGGRQGAVAAEGQGRTRTTPAPPRTC